MKKRCENQPYVNPKSVAVSLFDEDIFISGGFSARTVYKPRLYEPCCGADGRFVYGVIYVYGDSVIECRYTGPIYGASLASDHVDVKALQQVHIYYLARERKECNPTCRRGI